MDKLEFYKEIYLQVLDYTDERFIYKCATWGVEVENKITENNLLAVSLGEEKYASFIYALATAMIVGEFGKISFNDYLPEEAEIDLYDLEMNFKDITPFLNKGISKSRMNLLESKNFVRVDDLWDAVCECKGGIYKSLFEIYGKENKEPDVIIYQSLLELFGSIENCVDLGRQLSAITYVKNRFSL